MKPRTAVPVQRHNPFGISPEIGFRFAALTDGEGHFSIRKNGRSRAWTCCFTIKLRADDFAMLERFRAEVGLGSIYNATCKPTPGRDNKPSVQWHIQTKDECRRLVPIFEEYTLWSRKAEQFEVWAAAVRYWCAPESSLGRDTWGRMRQHIDWTPMHELASTLKSLREYA
jgi:hypothetical protein